MVSIWYMALAVIIPQIYMLAFGGAATSPETVRITVIITTFAAAIVISFLHKKGFL